MEEILIENLAFLTKNLSDRTRVLVLLVQNKILSLEEKDNIEGNVTQTAMEKNLALIQCILKKGDNALAVFIEILKSTGNSHIAVKIEETAARKKNLVRSQLKRPHSSLYPSSTLNIMNATASSKSLSQLNSQAEKVLKDRWWPEEKPLSPTFCDRITNGELIIEKLYAMLQENENRTTVITQDTLVVSGLGGIGKTSIAKSFANRYQKEYAYILWIDCGEKSLLKSFKELAFDLKIENGAGLSLKNLARECFKRLGGYKCLIIYDNAECYIGNEGIRDVLPRRGGCNLHSIITSRNQEWGTVAKERITKFLLNVFSSEESVIFLQNTLVGGSQISVGDLQKLAESLGHLPLALQIAVATLNTKKMAFKNYLQQLVKNVTKEIVLKEVELDDYERTINKTMKISLDQIRKDENGKNAYSILMNFGYLQPDDVKITFLRRIEQLSFCAVVRGLDLLQKYSLVTIENQYNPIDSEGVSIHRLLQQVIRHNGKPDEKETLRKILGCDENLRCKLIPCSYAEKYDDLRKEFFHIRTQLIEQVKLIELFAERSFSEAVRLSKMICKTILESANTDSQFPQHLISLYNQAVCLQRNGQINEAILCFKDLSKQLPRTMYYQQINMKCWVIHQDNLELQLLDLSDSVPDQCIINIFIYMHPLSNPSLQNSYDLLQNNIWSQIKTESSNIKTENRQREIGDLFQVLQLGLIISDALNKDITTRIIDSFEFFTNKDFGFWDGIVATLEKQMATRFKKERIANTDIVVFTKLFTIARESLYKFQIETRVDCQLGNAFLNVIKSKQSTLEIRSILYIFYFIRCKFVNADDETLKEMARILISFAGSSLKMLMNGLSTEDFRFKLPGLQIPKSKLHEFPPPEPVNSLVLEGGKMYLDCLGSCLKLFPNLGKIVLRINEFVGYYKDQIVLPKITHIEIAIDKGKEVEYACCTFSSIKSECLWEVLDTLEYYKVGCHKNYVEFCKSAKLLNISGVILHPHCHLYYGIKTFPGTAQSAFGMYIELGISSLIRSMPSRCSNVFDNLNHLRLEGGNEVVMLHLLQGIAIVEIRSMKVCFDISALESKNIALKHKLLLFHHIIPVGFSMHVQVQCVYVLNLQADKLEWTGSNNSYNLMHSRSLLTVVFTNCSIHKIVLRDIIVSDDIYLLCRYEMQKSNNWQPYQANSVQILDINYTERNDIHVQILEIFPVKILKLQNVTLVQDKNSAISSNLSKLVLLNFQEKLSSQACFLGNGTTLVCSVKTLFIFKIYLDNICRFRNRLQNMFLLIEASNTYKHLHLDNTESISVLITDKNITEEEFKIQAIV